MKTIIAQAPSAQNNIPEPVAGALGGSVTVVVLGMLYFIIKEAASYFKTKESAEEETMKGFIASSNANKSKLLDSLMQQQQEMFHDNLRQNKAVLDNIQENQLQLTRTQESLISLVGGIGANSTNNSAEIKALLKKIDEFTEKEMNRFLQAQTGIQIDVIRSYTKLEKSVEALHVRFDSMVGRSNLKPVVFQSLDSEDELQQRSG